MRKKTSFFVVGNDLDLFDSIEQDGGLVVGYFSLEDKKNSYQYLGSHKQISNFIKGSKSELLLAIDDCNLRQFLFELHKEALGTYISKGAYISKASSVGHGCVIYPKVHVGPNVRLGNCVKVSMGSQLHHDSKVGHFSVICPQVLMLGHANIGDECFIGSASTIAPKVGIGSQSVIGMGSLVIKDVIRNSVAYGVPAKKIRMV